MTTYHSINLKNPCVDRNAWEVPRLAFKSAIAFPSPEMFSLPDQLRRMVRSVGTQITEAQGKRRLCGPIDLEMPMREFAVDQFGLRSADN